MLLACLRNRAQPIYSKKKAEHNLNPKPEFLHLLSKPSVCSARSLGITAFQSSVEDGIRGIKKG